jgi:hypothetical protein
MVETGKGAPEREYRKFRCKASDGFSYKWFVGKTKDGKFKPLSVGSPKPPIPMDFAPFGVMDAVLNRSIVFDTLDEAERYARSL